MTQSDGSDLPAELRAVEGQLRQARQAFTSLELDHLKRRIMTRTARQGSPVAGQMRGQTMRHRLLLIGVTVLVIGGGTGGAIAAGVTSSTPNSARAQYHPCQTSKNPPKKCP